MRTTRIEVTAEEIATIVSAELAKRFGLQGNITVSVDWRRDALTNCLHSAVFELNEPEIKESAP